jgi:hypothetical protein
LRSTKGEQGRRNKQKKGVVRASLAGFFPFFAKHERNGRGPTPQRGERKGKKEGKKQRPQLLSLREEGGK